MKKSPLLLIGLALSAFAAHADDHMKAPNNSGVNERDRSTQTLTPEDQSQSKGDVELAAKIRRAVVGQSGVSVDGQNIKIITMNNAVTLRGPVRDKAEREALEKTVRAAAGSASVDNQLELK